MEELTLNTLLRPLRKWWWMVVACTLLATLASLLYGLQQPATYLSRATVVVGTALQDPNPDSGEFILASALTSSYADLLTRANVQEATKAALRMKVLPDYSARVVPNTQMIEIHVVDTDPLRAQLVANELITQLMAESPAGRKQSDRFSFIDEQLSHLQTSIEETQQELDRTRASLATLFSARQIQDMKTQISALETKLAALQGNYAGMLANSQQGATNTLRVLEPASLPDTPVDSSLMMQVVLATCAGMALAVAAAYALEYLDDTIRSGREAAQLFAAPVLATVPATRLALDTRIAALQRSDILHPGLDAYRSLYLKLSQGTANPPHRLLVAGVSAKELPAETASALGLAYAQAGKRVILVDADLHRPTLQHWWRLPNHAGVSTWLLSGGSVQDLLRTTHVPLLRVLTAGPLPPDPAALLLSTRPSELWVELRDLADVVIVTCAPVVAAVDAGALAPQMDGVLLVAAEQITTRALGRRAAALLRQMDARLLGIVLTEVSWEEAEFPTRYGYDVSPRAERKQSRRGAAQSTEVANAPAAPGYAWGLLGSSGRKPTSLRTAPKLPTQE